MERNLLPRLWIDDEWGMIEFMLSEMLFEVVNGKLRNVSDRFLSRVGTKSLLIDTSEVAC